MSEIKAFDSMEFNFKDKPNTDKKLRVDFFHIGINITGIIDKGEDVMIFLTKKQIIKIAQRYDIL